MKKTNMARYNLAVSQYQQACKKHKIKVSDQKYRHMSNENHIPFTLHRIAGNLELTKLVSSIHAIIENADRLETEIGAEKFLAGLNLSLYHNIGDVLNYTVDIVPNGESYATKVTITTNIGETLYGPVEVTIKNLNNNFTVEVFASTLTQKVLNNFGISSAMDAECDFDLTELLIRVQQETIDILQKTKMQRK